MRKIKFGSLFIPSVMFLVTLIIIMFNVFEKDPANSISTKNIIIYLINIVFWISAAFLVNKLSMIFFWSNLLKQPGKNSLFKLLYRIFSVLMYTIALGEILFGVLTFIIPETYFYIILILFFVGSIVFYDKIVDMFGTNQLNFEGSYNLGDWVELINAKSGVKISGKILDFTRKEIILQTPESGVAFIPNELKPDLIVINYDSLEEKNEFEINITVNYAIPSIRVKRILLACAREYFVQNEVKKCKSPQVVISSINEFGTVYKIKFYIKPYKDAVPSVVKDYIYNTIFDHFKAVGIELNNGVFSYIKSKDRESIPTEIEEMTELLKNIDIFTSLNSDELMFLSKNITQINIKSGDTLIKQGDEGSTMYILIEGLLSVNVLDGDKSIRVGLLKPGVFFGEMSLLTGATRNATIISETESIVYEIHKDSIEKIILARQEILNEIAEVVTERQKANLMKLEESKHHKDNLSSFVLGKIKDFLHIK